VRGKPIGGVGDASSAESRRPQSWQKVSWLGLSFPQVSQITWKAMGQRRRPASQGA
jgi:hypothetical protein